MQASSTRRFKDATVLIAIATILNAVSGLGDIGLGGDEDAAARGLARIASYTGKPSPPMTTWAEAARRIAENYGVCYPDFTPADWADYARASCVRDVDGAIRFDYDPDIAIGLKTGSATPDLWPLFDSLGTKPSLVLRGERSDLLSDATVAKMRARLPTLRAVTVPGRGHAPTLNEPSARAAIDALLTGADA